jgi:predicted GIY-YIG superfamily endonuclease
MQKTNIYILKLKRGHFYVGKSDNVKQRVDNHFKGKGCEWTKCHKPIKLVKTIKNVSHFEEDMQVKILMSKHGIDKVRGGSYNQIELNDTQIECLNNELNMAANKCLRCGRNTHFIKDCYASTHANGTPLIDSNEEDSQDSKIIFLILKMIFQIQIN